MTERTGQPVIVRSPADVLRAVTAVAALLAFLIVDALFGASIVGFAYDVLRGLDALADWLVAGVAAFVRVASLLLVAGGVIVAVVSGRWRALVSVIAGGAAGAGLFLIADALIDDQRPALVELSDFAGPLTGRSFPTSAGLAAIAGVATVAGPWLSRRLRRFGWVVVYGLAVVHFVAAPVSGAALAALLAGWAGGALAVVLLGAPAVRPTKEAVVSSLREVGVDLRSLDAAGVDARGSTPYFGEAGDGTRLFVKVLGRDERSADLLFRLYRRAVPRDLGDERPFSSLRRAIEHEALLSLAVRELGVRTPRFVTLCCAEPAGFVLAYEAIAGRSLDRVDATELTDDVLGQLWEQLGLLRAHRIAHRDLRLANLFLDEQASMWLIDFGFAELAASDLLMTTDLAEVVCSLATTIGAERAVGSAARALGSDALAVATPRMKLGYLSGATRTAMKAQPALLAEVTAAMAAMAVAAAAGPVTAGAQGDLGTSPLS